ncbi:putative sulfatase PB10D8.02c [Diplonema papillatum]|nr:putative sulfatase PB10D8.02c [Diplonema papillatum]|eukprot:gene11501-17704_t
MRARHTIAMLLTLASAVRAATKPNVMFILADDLGWNDIERHGSPQIQTSNINDLCDEGVQLNRYYGQPVCSPTRSTIMSGRHVIHSGIYEPFSQGTNQHLNLSWKLMPQYFAEAGYDTHMVGKWHLGMNLMDTLPTSRGFASYLGYWCGAEDYYTHEASSNAATGYDFQDMTEPTFAYNGTFSTFAFTERAVKILREQYANASANPFFFYLAYQNVHWPLEAPEEYMQKCAGKTGGNTARQTVCALATLLDDGIGNVTRALQDIGRLDNTIVVFSSDNGGPTNNTEGTQSNNYPLRGGKNTIWEGGTRLSGCIRGPNLPKKTVWNGLMHTTDWLYTLLDAAGAAPPETPQPGDGMSVWSSLSTSNATSPRSWILYETHPDNQQIVHGHAYQSGGMKIVWTGPSNPAQEHGWFPPPGQDPSTVHYTVDCGAPPSVPSNCGPSWCLFNVTADPCEYHDIATEHPEIVTALVNEIQVYQPSAVPPLKGQGCEPVIDAQGAWRPCD